MTNLNAKSFRTRRSRTRLLAWAAGGAGGGEEGGEGAAAVRRAGRTVTVCRVVEALAGRLRGIMVPYFAHALDLFVQVDINII